MTGLASRHKKINPMYFMTTGFNLKAPRSKQQIFWTVFDGMTFRIKEKIESSKF